MSHGYQKPGTDWAFCCLMVLLLVVLLATGYGLWTLYDEYWIRNNAPCSAMANWKVREVPLRCILE